MGKAHDDSCFCDCVLLYWVESEIGLSVCEEAKECFEKAEDLGFSEARQMLERFEREGQKP